MADLPELLDIQLDGDNQISATLSIPNPVGPEPPLSSTIRKSDNQVSSYENFMHKPGHYIQYCRKRLRNEEKKEKRTEISQNYLIRSDVSAKPSASDHVCRYGFVGGS